MVSGQEGSLAIFIKNICYNNCFKEPLQKEVKEYFN